MNRTRDQLPARAVSPGIKTVESVGATRVTCFSPDSRAGRSPIICSNLRWGETCSAHPTLSKASTEILHTAVAGLSGPTLQRRANALEQDHVVERLCHEFHSARS